MQLIMINGQLHFFMLLHELTTERLVLRQLKPEDADRIFVLRSDENVNRYLDRQPALTIEDAIAFIQKINTAVNNNASLYWAISAKDDPALIGTICIFNTDLEKGTAEIGYEMLPAFHGKGLMQEALATIIEYGFEVAGFNIIEAVPRADNERSVSLLKKNKFTRDSEAEKKFSEEDRAANLIIYSLRKDLR
ncbi:MAG TPA: GNAT family N-acetyltransferase [Ferruginibacter sp.]|nr:GNAT family N-acetyltransferase [Ferruginibacter sp.]